MDHHHHGELYYFTPFLAWKTNIFVAEANILEIVRTNIMIRWYKIKTNAKIKNIGNNKIDCQQHCEWMRKCNVLLCENQREGMQCQWSRVDRKNLFLRTTVLWNVHSVVGTVPVYARTPHPGCVYTNVWDFTASSHRARLRQFGGEMWSSCGATMITAMCTIVIPFDAA